MYRVIGYQFGSTDAFCSNIDQAYYVDGISITHGSPCNHIWTYAAASSSNSSDYMSFKGLSLF